MLLRKNNTSDMAYPEGSEEIAVLKAFETMQQAMIDKDMDTLDKVIKDGTIFTHMSGKQQTKAEYFAESKTELLITTAITLLICISQLTKIRLFSLALQHLMLMFTAFRATGTCIQMHILKR